MSVIIFVIDGLGMWSKEHASTYQILEDRFGIDPIVTFPVLSELGLIKAKEGCGNLLEQKSVGVGSLEGHREMLGYVSMDEYTILKEGIPADILLRAESECGFSCIGNIQGRGKQIIPQYWEQHEIKKSPIIYSGFDHTVSIAFDTGIIDVHVVYDFAKKLIGYLQSREAHIRKVIVREFLSSPHDLVSEKEIFIPINFNETIKDLGFENIVVNNKIQDIFDFCDATVIETKDDEDCFLQFRNLYSHARNSLIFLNLGDFDYNAHLGNIEGCLNTLSKVDLQLSRVRQQLATSDYLLITSDHGVSYDSSSLSFSHLKECTLFLLSNRNTIFYHPGIVLGHELVFDTVQAIQKSRKLSSLGFERIGD